MASNPIDVLPDDTVAVHTSHPGIASLSSALGHNSPSAKSIRRYAATQVKREADRLLNELITAVQQCQAAGQDCSQIKICAGQSCRMLFASPAESQTTTDES